MDQIKKKQIIKIPRNFKIFFNIKRKILIVKESARQNSLKINPQLTILGFKQQIKIINNKTKKLSNSKKKKIRLILNTTISLIRQLLIETSSKIYKKLKFVGVGYRAFSVKNFENRLLLLKLGYSHSIYFRIPLKTQIFSFKLTKLFLYGYNYKELTFTMFKIRANKVPEIYKGKGIFYENEQVILKEGKKI